MSSRSYGPPFGEEDSSDPDAVTTAKPAATQSKPSIKRPLSSRLDDSWFFSHYRTSGYGYFTARTPWSLQTPGQKLTVARRRLTLFVVAYLATALPFGGITRLNAMDETIFHVDDYLTAAGVGEGQTMPLDLGGQSTQSSSQINGSGFMFLGIGDAHVNGKSTTTRVITLGVGFGQTRYIMDVPLSQVQFKLEEGAKPSGSFTVHNDELDRMMSEGRCGSIWGYGVCHKIPGTPNIADSKVSKRAPGPMLKEYLDMFTLTVTPAQYRDYLNNGQPTSKR
jgi:hypothetical protein